MPLRDVRDHALIIAANGIQREFPAVLGVGNECPGDGHRHLRAVAAAIFQRAQKRRTVRKLFFRKEASNFELGIDAVPTRR